MNMEYERYTGWIYATKWHKFGGIDGIEILTHWQNLVRLQTKSLWLFEPPVIYSNLNPYHSKIAHFFCANKANKPFSRASIIFCPYLGKAPRLG